MEPTPSTSTNADRTTADSANTEAYGASSPQITPEITHALSPPPGKRLRLQPEVGRSGVLILAGGKLSRILPPLLPLIAALFFVWNAERSHQQFLERVPERDRAFFSRGTRPLLFFAPFLLLPGGFFVVTAVTTLRQTRLRSTPEQVTLSFSLLGVEFNRRSFARPGVQGVRLKRVGPDMPSYTLRTPASPEARREAETRLAYPSDALLVTASGERALVRNLTPEEGQWLRGALREMQLTEIVDRSRDSPEIPVPMPRGKEAERLNRLNRLEGTSQSTNRLEDQSLSERWMIGLSFRSRC
jgi:hypothetical protein